MGNKTGIEWADASLNLAWGCTEVSKGCEKCYAKRISKYEPFYFHLMNFEKKQIELAKLKTPKIIFTNSMSDTFHEKVDDETLDKWFKLFVDNSQHVFIILTKRINKAYNYFKTRQVPDNCWIGTSIEDKYNLHRIKKLKLIDAKTRFISFEPLLGDIGKIDLSGISWTIVGGESDYKNPRRMDPQWAVNIRDQCKEQNVAFFFKQMGGSSKDVEGHWGGNKLNGETYLEYPYLPKSKSKELDTYQKKLFG